MSAQSTETALPPIEAVSSEVIAGLAFAAHGYLEPQADGATPDLDSAEIALDLAGACFDRISPRLGETERTSLGRLLTELRMSYVRKRGL